MSNANIKSQKLAISTIQSINTISEDYTDYTAFKTEPFDLPVPNPQIIDDAGTVGDGVGYSQNSVVYRWLPVNIPLRGRLEDELFPLLFARALGGTVVDADVTATTSYDHTIPMATEQELVEPKLFNIMTKGVRADFLWGDCYVQGITISQQGDDLPMYDAQIVGAGYHMKVSDSSLVASSIPAVASTFWSKPKYHGAATTLTYNNGSAIDLTASRGLISVSAKITQPCEIKNLPGDSFLTDGDVESGAYPGTINRQTQEQDIITLRVYSDSTLSQWLDLKANTTLTNVILKFKGKVIGASTDHYETEVKLTRAEVMSVTGATDTEYEALDIVIKALPDSSTKRLAIGRVRNGTATLA